MIKNMLLLIFIIICGTLSAQSDLLINYNLIEDLITDKNSETYYPKLLERYNKLDSTLTTEDYVLIYYGFSFQKEYSPYSNNDKELREYVKANDYTNIVTACKKILANNPVDLNANNQLWYALQKLGRPESEWIGYLRHYRAIRKVIVYSGDGLTCKTAFKVIFVPDEYNILRSYFDINNIKSQSLVDGKCDMFSIVGNERYNAKGMYFDISRCLIKTSKMFAE